MPILARTTIGVVGSGKRTYDELAINLGTLLAELRVNLLTGGGAGVMTSVSRAYRNAVPAEGICIGIIPSTEGDPSTPLPGYPNEFVDLPIYTHLPYSGSRGMDDLSRNHINVLSSAAVVALPGDEGTRCEVALALKYGKPVIIYTDRETSVASFPQPPGRVFDIEAVRAFLLPYIR